MMTLNDYQEKAKVTDVRPAEYKMICNGFGLWGEGEELDAALITSPVDKDNIIKEFGDILWYTSSICTAFGVSLERVFHKFPKGFSDDKPVGEVFKKVYRDKAGVFDEEDKERILAYLHFTLNHYASFVDINEAAERNINKLYSRMERGKIQGNGDNR